MSEAMSEGTTTRSRTHCEVWGDPIAHSKSPDLHRAAYAQQGLDWSYERRQVTAVEFAQTLASQRSVLRGLSVTMPLKEEALKASDAADRFATLTGAANTLLIGERVEAFNTDVPGIVAAFAEHGVRSVPRARILGAGATAASALCALAELGAQEIEVRARRPERAAELQALGEKLGVQVLACALTALVDDRDVTIATLPAGVALPDDLARSLGDHGGALLDVAYAPWPSALASIWSGEPVISGLLMLLHQAVRQVRIFVQGNDQTPLDNEDALVTVMRSALMGD